MQLSTSRSSVASGECCNLSNREAEDETDELQVERIREAEQPTEEIEVTQWSQDIAREEEIGNFEESRRLPFSLLSVNGIIAEFKELRKRSADEHYAEECEERIKILKGLLRRIPKICEENRREFEREEHERASKVAQAVHHFHKISSKGLYVCDKFMVRDKSGSEICEVSLTMATHNKIPADSKMEKEYKITLDVTDNGVIRQVRVKECQVIRGKIITPISDCDLPSTSGIQQKRRKCETSPVKLTDQRENKKKNKSVD